MIGWIWFKLAIWSEKKRRLYYYKKAYRPEWKRLQSLIDRVSIECKAKLKEKLEEGYYGWNDPGVIDELKEKFFEHVEKGLSDKENIIDIINLAAFIWNISEDNVF